MQTCANIAVKRNVYHKTRIQIMPMQWNVFIIEYMPGLFWRNYFNCATCVPPHAFILHISNISDVSFSTFSLISSF